MLLEIKNTHFGLKKWAIDLQFGMLIDTMKVYNIYSVVYKFLENKWIL